MAKLDSKPGGDGEKPPIDHVVGCPLLEASEDVSFSNKQLKNFIFNLFSESKRLFLLLFSRW